MFPYLAIKTINLSGCTHFRGAVMTEGKTKERSLFWYALIMVLIIVIALLGSLLLAFLFFYLFANLGNSFIPIMLVLFCLAIAALYIHNANKKKTLKKIEAQQKT